MIKVSCIIPFYNESLNPPYVIESVRKLRPRPEIIAVDDGSDDNSAFMALKQKYKDIVLLKLSKNKGKAGAIKSALAHVTSNYVLLIDGDLSSIKEYGITKAVDRIIKNPEIDMIILRRTNDKTAAYLPFLRDDIILSGQRILKTEDLRKVFAKTINGYKLESEINSFMMKRNKKVFWMPLSIKNRHKQHKWGYWEGIKIGLPGFFRYMFSPEMVRQILFFCKEEAI